MGMDGWPKKTGLKSNSTSTLFVSSTISVPDLCEIILSVSSVLQAQMMRSVAEADDRRQASNDQLDKHVFLRARDRARLVAEGKQDTSTEEDDTDEDDIEKEFDFNRKLGNPLTTSREQSVKLCEERYNKYRYRKAFAYFDELRYHASRNGVTGGKLAEVVTPKHVYPEPPSVNEIYTYLKCIFDTAQFSPECNIIALVYTNRLLAFTDMPMHANNWRLLFLSALLLAQKVWDDKSLGNVDFPIIWQAAVEAEATDLITLPDVNRLERKFLELLQYNVTVNLTLYAKYYFELRALHRKTSKRKENELNPLSLAQAVKLEARISDLMIGKWTVGSSLSGAQNLKSLIGRSKTQDAEGHYTAKARAVLS